MDLTDSQLRAVVDGLNISEDSEGGEEITYEEAVKRLTQCWLNEQASPKLLPCQYELLEPLVLRIEEIESDLAKCKEDQKLKLSVNILRMEISRLQYVINSYLRSRLQKIEKDPVGVLQDHETRVTQDPPADPLLSEQEIKFAETYFESTKKLMFDEFLENLAPALQRIPRIKDPYANSRVFIEVLSDDAESMTVQHLTDKNAEYVVPLKKGSRYLAPFKSIEELLEKGYVRLL